MTEYAHKNRFTPDGKMSFAPTPQGDLSEIISGLVDDALVSHTRVEYERTRGAGTGDVAKKRIGAGYIGVECGRELAYRYHRFEKREERSVVNPGELQRHAESGHWTEDKTAEWLRLAGFDLRTCFQDEYGNPVMNAFGQPKQIGFYAAKDSITGQARIAGEVDGVILATPPAIGGRIKTPCIWESKKGTAKKWKKFKEDGVEVADPKYYGQLQTNMAYMEVRQTLFSMLNLDTMKYHWELIEFDPAKAQWLTDRAVKVIQTEHPKDMPRITRDPSDCRCKFCPYSWDCWADGPETGLIARPSWLSAPTV